MAKCACGSSTVTAHEIPGTDFPRRVHDHCQACGFSWGIKS